MKKWQTITATALLSASLAGIGTNFYHAMQPTHYQGETFVNEKKSSDSHSSSSTSTSQSTSDSSSSTATTDYDTSVNNSASQPASVAEANEANHEQRTFSIASIDEIDGQEMTYVVFLPTGECTGNMPVAEALAFCKYMNNIAGGEDHLNHSLQDNYNYWKGQQ